MSEAKGVPTKIMNTTYRERRLIAAMSLGIHIEFQDGHRWIEAADFLDGDVGFSGRLKAYGLLLNNKIYGGVDEALDVIDEALKAMDDKTLAERFNAYFDEEEHVTGRSSYSDRVDMVEPGKGGLV